MNLNYEFYPFKCGYIKLHNYECSYIRMSEGIYNIPFMRVMTEPIFLHGSELWLPTQEIYLKYLAEMKFLRSIGIG